MSGSARSDGDSDCSVPSQASYPHHIRLVKSGSQGLLEAYLDRASIGIPVKLVCTSYWLHQECAGSSIVSIVS